jgi:hypothetical protein
MAKALDLKAVQKRLMISRDRRFRFENLIGKQYENHIGSHTGLSSHCERRLHPAPFAPG